MLPINFRVRVQELAFSAILLLGWRLHNVVGLPKIISGGALRRMEGTPALGRGYSVTTNAIMGTCLNITQNATEHSNSYNFECEFQVFKYSIQILYANNQCNMIRGCMHVCMCG